MWAEGFLEPIRAPGTPHSEKEPDYLFEWLVYGRAIQFKRMTAVRGLSCKVGIHIAAAVEEILTATEQGRQASEGIEWALVMLKDIRMRREPVPDDRLDAGEDDYSEESMP